LPVFRNSKPTTAHLFTVNIKEYHWLVHQPITSHAPPPLLYELSHYHCHEDRNRRKPNKVALANREWGAPGMTAMNAGMICCSGCFWSHAF